MYVYLIKRVYSNGVSVTDYVFSSKPKANKYLKWYLESVEKDGWAVTQVVDMYRGNGYGFKITPPSGNDASAESFFIVKMEIK